MAIMWAILIRKIHISEETLQRKRAKLTVAYLFLVASLSKMTVYLSTFGVLQFSGIVISVIKHSLTTWASVSIYSFMGFFGVGEVA